VKFRFFCGTPWDHHKTYAKSVPMVFLNFRFFLNEKGFLGVVMADRCGGVAAVVGVVCDGHADKIDGKRWGGAG
jgi:hypothetical protein